ncbi:hypothetical protein HC251_07945 [Iamia sp. SCSIO 61187]|uniref:hypothetical protein n=1 Tax=Iamia sp. SCSIO 61187 TaxID=2722752 RepID=UPI001C6249FA|nr:hypothetical protein [Iamia sp. SCSIO 61187]QYG92379.1 hypothetical protein HC251_07945 [Iamia sp. SCSIO 61187]
MADTSLHGDIAAARRRADAMVGLFVAAVVAVIAAVAVLATKGSAAFAIGLIVAAVVFGAVSIALLRSITPEERARLTATVPGGSNADEDPDLATDDQGPEEPR